MQPVARETFIERRQSFVRWSAIIAGVLVAIASWMTLQVIGVGAGLATVDATDTSSLRGAGIGAGVWSLIAPLIALFLGGFAAARASSVVDRGTAAVHGAVLWALTTIAGAFFAVWLVSSLVSGAARAGGSVLSAAGQTVGAGAGRIDRGSFAALGLDANDLVAPVNQRLRAEGKPAVTASQLEAAAKDALRTSVRTGDLDRDALVESLASRTSLSRADAEDIADRIEQRWGTATDRARELGDRATQTALSATDTSGKAMLGLGLALLLGLGASVGGAVAGSTLRSRSRHVDPHRRPDARHDTMTGVPPAVG